MPAATLKPLTLAVLSDLHVGRGARARDFSPYPDHSTADSDYKTDFLRFVRKQKLGADYLIVPGDASHQGQPDELALASRIILDCAEVLGVKPANILFVPGNHDADWTVFEYPDATGFRREQRYAPLRNDAWVFEQVIRRADAHMLDPHYASVWEYKNLVAVGYNSAWDDDSIKGVHHGLIANDHIDNLVDRIRVLDLSAKRLRLFLVHHHPIVYSDPVPDEPDFSAMTNAPRLLEVLRTFHFDFVIHGHRHCPVFQTISVDADYPLAILCAGSFSAELDRRWSGLVNNQFHLVTVEGRDALTNQAFGNVRSWTYLTKHGWIPSREHNGIRHIHPFGTYIQPDELVRVLAPVIEKALATADYVLWASLEGQLPKLKYLPPKAIDRALRELSRALNFTFHDATSGLILLKEEPGP
ncbi:MAG: metallophosphoesterase [Candidatus Korobacteraceae bacterium]